MKKQDALKLTVVTASVAALGVGCASSGYARYDNDTTNTGMAMSADANAGGMGVSAGAQVGADADRDTSWSARSDRDMDYSTDRSMAHLDDADEGAARITVSALSFTPETRAAWVNKFPFYDWRLSTIETYTFAVPDPTLNVSASTDLPEFSVNLPPGSVFVESAGGAGEVQTGRVIQHSPIPSR